MENVSQWNILMSIAIEIDQSQHFLLPLQVDDGSGSGCGANDCNFIFMQLRRRRRRRLSMNMIPSQGRGAGGGGWEVFLRSNSSTLISVHKHSVKLNEELENLNYY